MRAADSEAPGGDWRGCCLLQSPLTLSSAVLAARHHSTIAAHQQITAAVMRQRGGRYASSPTPGLSCQLTRLLSPLASPLASLRSLLSSAAWWSLKLWLLLLSLFALAVSLLVWSCMLYALLYRGLVPPSSLSRAVQLDYAVSPHPVAIVPIASAQQWVDLRTDASGAVVEQANGDGELGLAPGHDYNLFLDLSYPSSGTNHGVGMLSIEVVALSGDRPLARSLVSFLPSYRSSLVRWMWRWAFAAPLVLGWIDEAQNTRLTMFEHIVEQAEQPITHMRVEIKGANANKFQLYSANLTAQVQLYGLRYYMFFWPVTTAVVIISCLFSIHLVGCSVTLLLLFLCFCTGGDEEEEEVAAENGISVEGDGWDAASSSSDSSVQPTPSPGGVFDADGDESDADVFLRDVGSEPQWDQQLHQQFGVDAEEFEHAYDHAFDSTTQSSPSARVSPRGDNNEGRRREPRAESFGAPRRQQQELLRRRKKGGNDSSGHGRSSPSSPASIPSPNTFVSVASADRAGADLHPSSGSAFRRPSSVASASSANTRPYSPAAPLSSSSASSSASDNEGEGHARAERDVDRMPLRHSPLQPHSRSRSPLPSRPSSA